MDHSQIDYYEILGVTSESDADTVKKAFVEKARLLIEAYQVLTDKSAREQYNLSLDFKKTDLQQKQNELSPEEALQKLIVSLDGRKMLSGQKITKRLLSRIPVDKTIVVILSDKTSHAGVLKDLSGNGARIAIQTKLEVGQIFEVALSEKESPFVMAQVVRTVAEGQEYGVKWIQVFEKNLPKGFLSKKTF